MLLKNQGSTPDPSYTTLESISIVSMVKNFSNYVGLLNRVTEVIVIIAYVVLMVAIPAAVFFRYVLNNSIVWAEELARYLFVWITFLGAGLGVGKKVHVGIDAVTRRLPSNLRANIGLAVNIGIMGFLIGLIAYGTQFTLFGIGNKALVLGIPMAFVYLAVPIGGLVMLSNVILDILQLLENKIRERTL